MKFVATIGDRAERVEVTGAHGRYRLMIESEVWEVDARLTAQGIYSLLIDGVSYVADVTARDGACVVGVADETYVIQVEEATRTLIRCVNALEPIQGGELVVLGESLTKPGVSLPALRTRVGMVFQSFNLFPHMTVLENIMLAPVKVRGLSAAEASRVARALLERVRIPDKAENYPANLSGGQQQRVAIARALAMQPKIMLFDEPTSALDPEMINEVLDVMTDLARDGMTMIVVTHEMGFARRVAHRIVFMDAGQVVEEAPPDLFFAAAKSDRAREFLSKILTH